MVIRWHLREKMKEITGYLPRDIAVTTFYHRVKRLFSIDFQSHMPCNGCNLFLIMCVFPSPTQQKKKNGNGVSHDKLDANTETVYFPLPCSLYFTHISPPKYFHCNSDSNAEYIRFNIYSMFTDLIYLAINLKVEAN